MYAPRELRPVRAGDSCGPRELHHTHPRLSVSVAIAMCAAVRALILLLTLMSAGCATVPEERHGQEVAAVAVMVAAGVGIFVARSIAHSGQSQVQQMRNPTTRTVLGPP